jgi:hypothetical protein
MSFRNEGRLGAVEIVAMTVQIKKGITAGWLQEKEVENENF